MDCRGDASAASAGSILVTRMMVRGAAGVVTDGGLRDSHEIAKLGIPTYCKAPSAPTNLLKHHAVDIDVPIACGEVAVYPGDIMVGDAEGVVVIPGEIAEAVAAEATAQTQFEDFVMEQVQGGRKIFGLYPPTDPATNEQFKVWCAEKSGKPA
jgi:regulator of RNase E activity RraA